MLPRLMLAAIALSSSTAALAEFYVVSPLARLDQGAPTPEPTPAPHVELRLQSLAAVAMEPGAAQLDLAPLITGTNKANLAWTVSAPFSVNAAGVLTGTLARGTHTAAVEVTNEISERAQASYTFEVAYIPFTLNYTVPSSTLNLSIDALLQNNGWNGQAPVQLELTVPSSVVLGSSSTAVASLRIPVLPEGSRVYVSNQGYIVGRGGSGSGSTGYNTTPVSGGAGGPAIEALGPVTISNHGVIGGGGGAGGSANQYAPTSSYGIGAAGSGGGAGYPAGSGGQGSSTTTPGTNGTNGNDGTLTAGGLAGTTGRYSNIAGLTGGNGGALGAAGGAGQSATHFNGVNYGSSAGGLAGAAVINPSNVTWALKGSVLGSH